MLQKPVVVKSKMPEYNPYTPSRKNTTIIPYSTPKSKKMSFNDELERFEDRFEPVQNDYYPNK